MMRSFPFLSSSFPESRTLVHSSLPQHHRQRIIVLPPPPKRRDSTEQIVKAALGEETGKSQPHGLRRDSRTCAGSGACQQRTRHARGPATEATQHASSVQHVASLRPARSPHTALVPGPHLVSLHNSFDNFMLNVLGLPAMGRGTLFRATSSHRGVNHMCFQQCNHLGI